MRKLSILLLGIMIVGFTPACDDSEDNPVPVGTATLLHTIEEAGNRIDISPDGTSLLTTRADARINVGPNDILPRLWNIADAGHIRDFTVKESIPVREIDFLYARFHPNGDVIGRGEFTRFRGPRVHVLTQWDAQTGETIRSLELGYGYQVFNTLTVSPNGKIIAMTSGKDSLHLYDGQNLRFIRAVAANVYSDEFRLDADWTNDSQWLALSDGTFVQFGPGTDAGNLSVIEPDNRISRATFLSSSQLLIARANGFFGIAGLPDFNDMRRLSNIPSGEITAVASSANGAYFAGAGRHPSDSDLNQIIVYRGSDGATIAEIDTPISRIVEMQFAQDGQILISANSSQDVRIYRIDLFK